MQKFIAADAIIASIIFLSAVAISVLLLIFYADRQLVLFFQSLNPLPTELLHRIQQLPEIGYWLAPAFAAVWYWRRRIHIMPKQIDWFLLTFCLTVALTALLKITAKIIFARPWPDTFIANPSFLQDGVYQFTFFSTNPGLHAFPSGHAALLFSSATVIMLFYPRTLVYCAVIIVVVCLSLLVLNYHFISDVLAGAALGVLIAFWVHRYLTRRHSMF